ncbi:hypothetical protein [Phenylobacterium aquaticum]|uniref:hypothetical protein n=1 Tax=Phenylobacterium aquaticum TaxID=1763816 RepID=UPI0026F0E0B3|nr:hypothetical protein [Phenylobacterium aquaticum]
MSLSTTLAVIAVLTAIALFSGWRGARPWDPRRGPRLMPWRLIMVTAATGGMIFLVHLVNLLGVTTGRP